MQTKLNTKRLSLFFSSLPRWISFLAKRKRFLSSSFSQSFQNFLFFEEEGDWNKRRDRDSCRVRLSAPVVEVDFGRATTGEIKRSTVGAYTLCNYRIVREGAEKRGKFRYLSICRCALIEDRFTSGKVDKPIHLRSRLIEIKLRPDYRTSSFHSCRDT